MRPSCVGMLAVVGSAVAGLLAFAAVPTASATPAITAHPVPGGVMHSNGVDTQCYDATGFTCAGGGYNGTSAQIGGNGWTSSQYWAYGSPGPASTRHNCTTYAAYRLQQDGVAFPGWTDNANGWDTKAPASTVDQTPVVGSIAQWNVGSGHVAYVEAVTADSIVTTSDSYDGGTDRLQISRTSTYFPDNFIHFKDSATNVGGATPAPSTSASSSPSTPTSSPQATPSPGTSQATPTPTSTPTSTPAPSASPGGQQTLDVTLAQVSHDGVVALSTFTDQKWKGDAVYYFRRSGLTSKVQPMGRSIVDENGVATRTLRMQAGQILALYCKLLGASGIDPYSNTVSFKVQ